jgi:hypothetical protein
MWEADKDELQEMRKNMEEFKGVVPTTAPKLAGQLDPEDIEQAEDPRPRMMIHPHGLQRISWDLGSLLMVSYDIVMVPMATFDLSDNLFIDVMTWMTRLFWTFDMGMSVCTGVVMPDGRITFDFKYILRRYLWTWFVLDTFIVTTDWAEFFMSQGGGGASLTKLTRAFRIVRVVRLLRLLRMKSVMQTISERIQSDNLFFVLNVIKMALFLLTFGHIFACMWWGLGKRSAEETWSKDYSGTEVSTESQYLLSLQWTLSQFSGGMEEVRPRAAIERFFAVIMWVVTFMAAAIVASILTSSLVQAHIIGGSQARQLSTLRRYLNQNSISKNLALRVQRSAKHAISGDLSPDAVDLLGVVSDQLRLEMHFEMYSELFRCHPFFDMCMQYCPQVMRKICHQAANTVLLDTSDILFNKGESPAEPKMFFIFKGSCEYLTPAGETVVLGEKQWIGEPVLWLQWVHRGTLKATTDVKVAKLDARRLQDIMERFKEVFPSGFNPKVYAHDYARNVNEIAFGTPELVNDLVTYTLRQPTNSMAPRDLLRTMTKTLKGPGTGSQED